MYLISQKVFSNFTDWIRHIFTTYHNKVYTKLPLVVETNSHICIVKQNTGMLYVSLINQDKSRLSQEFKDFETIVRLFVQG